MSDDLRAAHLSAEELLDYFEEKVPDEQQRDIEEHLAICDACTMLARDVHAFNDAWSWTAATHGVLHQREVLAHVLETAAEASPALRDRLQAWRQRWAGCAEAGLRVAVEASATAVRVVAEGLDGLARPGSAWQFSPLPRAASARGEADDDAASALLSTAVAPDRPRARVAVRAGRSSEIEARVDDLAPDHPAPIVLLAQLEAGRPARVWLAEAERRPGATYRIARFGDVEPGEYLVAFEPLATDA